MSISTPSLLVQPSGSGTQVTEGSSNDTYSLALSTQPSSPVTVTLSPNSQISLDKTQVIFTATNWAQPQVVTITAVDDTVQEGPHTGQISHQITTSDSDYSGLSVPNLVVNVVDNDSGTPITIQAEAIASLPGGSVSAYRAEKDTDASGGSMLSLLGGAANETGTASFNFTGVAANYNVILGSFDENDGVATLQVAKNGASIGSVLLNQNKGSNAATAATKVALQVATGVAIAPGDRITITGIENAGEPARFDFIRFEPVSAQLSILSIAAGPNGAEPATPGQFIVSLSQAVTVATTVSYTVSGTATAGSDYTALSGSVTIPAGQTSATINVPVLDDTLNDPNETVTVSLTAITGGGQGVVLGSTKSATITISDDDVTGTPITIQAEAIASLPGGSVSAYRVEKDTDASGGSMLSLLGGAANETGTASFNFTGVAVNYNVILGSFDENDGVATLQVAKNGASIGSVLLNQNKGSNAATAVTKVALQVATGVAIAPGDRITITGIENAGEPARFDFIRFEPVSAPLSILSIAAGPNGAEPATPGQFIVSLSQAVTAATTVSYTVSGTATAGSDYTALSGSVTIPAGQTSATINVPVLDDTLKDPNETVTVSLTAITGGGQGVVLGSTKSATITISDDDLPGAAKLGITVSSDWVQKSNFGSNSFQLTNVGDKSISKVVIDVTNALYPDTVFDPFGLAGDTTFKALTIDTNGGTGIIAPNPGTAYIGTGGVKGYEGIQLLFDASVDGGFQPGETVGFSIDMDPNSIAGSTKSTLDSGSVPAWDVGGVSGAELIGSSFTVTFTDGTSATGQIQGAKNQAGSKGLASLDSPNQTVSLTVNGLGAGGVGTYSSSAPSVIVNGPAGKTARIVLTKGMIQPVNNNFTGTYGAQLQAQLDALAASAFPANNAAYFQTVDVLLTGSAQNITSSFDFTQVPGYVLAVNEAQLPLGFVASVIDPSNDDLPLGPVTAPIYLRYENLPLQPVTLKAKAADITMEAEAADTIINYRNESITAASGGTALSFVGGSSGETGSAVFVFGDSPDEISGTYDIIIGAFDENDGLASFTANLTDFETGLTTQLGSQILLNAQLGSDAANASTFVTPTLATGIALTAGDIIKVNGFEQASEAASFDFLRLVPTL